MIFDIEGTFSEDDLEKIEEKMREIAKENLPVFRQELDRDEAVNLFKERGENYKVEIIEQIDSADPISAYGQGDFIDLCRGPHVPTTGRIKHFKLLNTSGAYWRGDENNKNAPADLRDGFLNKGCTQGLFEIPGRNQKT